MTVREGATPRLPKSPRLRKSSRRPAAAVQRPDFRSLQDFGSLRAARSFSKLRVVPMHPDDTERDIRLVELLDQALSELRSGRAVDTATWQALHPDLPADLPDL